MIKDVDIKISTIKDDPNMSSFLTLAAGLYMISFTCGVHTSWQIFVLAPCNQQVNTNMYIQYIRQTIAD